MSMYLSLSNELLGIKTSEDTGKTGAATEVWTPARKETRERPSVLVLGIVPL